MMDLNARGFLGGIPEVCTVPEVQRAREGALVMQVYQYGDLWTLLEKHIRCGRSIPEPFIWHALIMLSKALLHMQRGSPPTPRNDYD
jgi:hypothetical protein